MTASAKYPTHQDLPRFFRKSPNQVPPHPPASPPSKASKVSSPYSSARSPGGLVRSVSASSVGAEDNKPILVRGSSQTSAATPSDDSENDNGEDDNDEDEGQRADGALANLKAKESTLLNFTELASIEALLNSHGTPPSPGSSSGSRLSYESFSRIRSSVSKRASKYFTAGMFLSFTPDGEGKIDGGEFFRRLCSTICIAKTRITLQFYDAGGRGLLREQ
ncbi:hypothetical protein TrRE_jg7526, partial [Triparma retinervis]